MASLCRHVFHPRYERKGKAISTENIAVRANEEQLAMNTSSLQNSCRRSVENWHIRCDEMFVWPVANTEWRRVLKLLSINSFIQETHSLMSMSPAFGHLKIWL